MSPFEDLGVPPPSAGDASPRHALMDTLPALVVVARPGGLDAVYANTRFRAYTGLAGPALEGKGWLQALHPQDVEHTKAALAGSGGSKEPAETHCRLRRHDGRYHRHMCRGEAVRDESGLIVERLVSCVDVDAAHAADETDALLAAIVSDSDDAIVSKSSDGVIRSWNTAAERLFGYSAAEAIGRPLTLIIPPDRRDEEDEIRAKLRRGERIDHFETVRVAKDGRRIDVWVTISPIRDRAGNIIGASKVARDASHHRQAEQLAREREERYEFVLAAAGAAIWDWDVPCNRVLYSARWKQLRGLAEDEVSESPDEWVSRIHPDDVERVLAAVHAHFEGRTAVFEQEYRVRHKDGRWIWLWDRGLAKHNDTGEVLRMAGSETDITERKRAEAELHEADRRKNEFLAVLGHELRNPLAPLSTGLELLERASDDKELAENVRNMMSRQLGHLVRLVDDLVDVSRISRGTIELRLEHVDMRDVVRAAVELTKPPLTERGHELLLPSNRKVLPVKGDFERLTQVLANLLGNAVKYTPPGGKITVGAETTGGHVVVHVADNGLGIPRERLGELFTMFSRVPEHRAHDPGSGLGIGLALSRQLVDLHGGTIEARSEGLGRGSEFIVRLPRVGSADATRARVAAPAIAAGKAPPRRILVVDDNVDAADSLLTLLRLGGHEVEAVHDGQTAVDAAARFAPDIVLLDIGLPHIDGYEVARRIRARAGGERVLLVALTGWGQEKDRRLSKEAGFDEHITKPVDTATLARLLADSRVKAPG